jgi:hypothetical protein
VLFPIFTVASALHARPYVSAPLLLGLTLLQIRQLVHYVTFVPPAP